MSERKRVIDALGAKRVSKVCGMVSLNTVYTWKRDGFPRTEYSGETSYAKAIAAEFNESVKPTTAKRLLDR